MQPQANSIIDLEKRFWQSMVDNDTDTAVEMLYEPSLMVSAHGAIKFGHADFRRLAGKDSLALKSYELTNMQVVFPNDTTAVLTYHAKQTVAPRGTNDGARTQEMNDTSTWVRAADGWKCVMHTETPAGKSAKH